MLSNKRPRSTGRSEPTEKWPGVMRASLNGGPTRDMKARLAGVDRFGLPKIFVVYTAYIVDICIGDTLKYIFCGNDCAIMKML